MTEERQIVPSTTLRLMTLAVVDLVVGQVLGVASRPLFSVSTTALDIVFFCLLIAASGSMIVKVRHLRPVVRQPVLAIGIIPVVGVVVSWFIIVCGYLFGVLAPFPLALVAVVVGLLVIERLTGGQPPWSRQSWLWRASN